MAAPDVAYADFSALYGNAVGEEAFAASLPHAVALVRDLTHPNEPVGEHQADAWTRAVCAAVAADAETGGGHGLGVSGFRIGSYSQFAGGGTNPGETMRAAAARELVGSGLLYMGLGGL